MAKKILDYYGKNSFTVQITATYSKPITDYNIQKENWILWDLEDIKLCKNIHKEINLKRLIEKHDYRFEDIYKTFSIENIINEYSKYPELWILSDKLEPNINEYIINETKNNEYGWSPDACFLLKQGVKDNIDESKNFYVKNDNENNNNKKLILKEEFQNEQENLKIWYRIFGKKDKLGIPDKEYTDDKVFIKRIEKICKNPNIDSRFIGENEFQNEPMLILAFLPQNNIDKISTAVINLLDKYNVINDYDIISINSKITNNPKQLIEDARIIARNNNKKGLLILSGKQCSLGVSIDNCDIVLLLNNSMSFDMIYQMMFRCMTEGKNKKCGFIIDPYIKRVIKTSIIDYANIVKPEIHPKDAVKYILQERLINLNGDHWMPTFGNHINKLEKICEKIYDIYSSSTVSALDSILNRLKFKEILLSKDDQRIFNIMFNNVNPTKEQQKIIENAFNNDKETDEIKKGIEKIKIENDTNDNINNDTNDNINNDNINNDTNDNTKDKKINYIDILKHIIPLISILTIHNEDTTFIEMFKLIENNKDLYEILLDQTKSWWGKNIDKNIIKKFIDIYIQHIKNDNEINIVVRTVKELFIKNISNSNQLSQLIDKYFIPQELEKKTNAEVSTPYNLRQDMINKIPNKFWTKIQKVFEPCSGKGGFIIDIIDKFMDGMKELIPDNKCRYKAIVEDCLYFSDINPTNIFICKLLIDPYNEYKLNYNRGNTLEIDVNSKWDINGFDAIIGNPPYQAPRNKENKTKGGGGDLLWNKFVFYSIKILNKDGYLCYIHPAGWRKPEGLSIKNNSKYKGLYELITRENQLLYLNINDTKEGIKQFKCGTRFDYYLLQKCKPYIKTIIIDEENKEIELDLFNIPFIPNKNINMIMKLISSNINDNIQILRPGGDPRREYINDKKSDEYKYTMIHSTPISGVRYKYSNEKKKTDHFGIKKIIIGETGITKNIVLDNEGVYGCTSSCFSIYGNDINVFNSLLSKKFKIFISSCLWSNYRIDWRLFTYLRNDFWKEFI